MKGIQCRPWSEAILCGVWSESIQFAEGLGPVVQSVVSLTSSLRVILLTVLADSIYDILIFFAEKMCSKKFQRICVSLDVNFNELLTNDVVSFEQLGPVCCPVLHKNIQQMFENFVHY